MIENNSCNERLPVCVVLESKSSSLTTKMTASQTCIESDSYGHVLAPTDRRMAFSAEPLSSLMYRRSNERRSELNWSKREILGSWPSSKHFIGFCQRTARIHPPDKTHWKNQFTNSKHGVKKDVRTYNEKSPSYPSQRLMTEDSMLPIHPWWVWNQTGGDILLFVQRCSVFWQSRSNNSH